MTAIQILEKLRTKLKIPSNWDLKKDNLLVTISDIHLVNSATHGTYNEDGVNTDLLTKVSIMKRAANLAKKLGCPLIFGGDLTDERIIDGVTLFYSAEVIDHIEKQLGSNWLAICGNHEIEDAATKFSTLKYYKFFVLGKIITEPGIHSIIQDDKKEVIFYCLPASQKIQIKLKEMLKALESKNIKKDNSFRILLIHGGIEGADYGHMVANHGIKAELIKKAAKLFDYVICGDFHKHQNVLELENVYYCGAPCQMNNGDIGQKRGFQILNLTKKSFIHIESNAPKFLKIEWMPGIKDHIWFKNPEKYQNKIKNKIITINIISDEKTNINDAFKRYEEIKQKFLELGASRVFKTQEKVKEQRNASKLNKNMSKNEIIRKFVDMKEYQAPNYKKDRKKQIGEQYSEKSS